MMEESLLQLSGGAYIAEITQALPLSQHPRLSHLRFGEDSWLREGTSAMFSFEPTGETGASESAQHFRSRSSDKDDEDLGGP